MDDAVPPPDALTGANAWPAPLDAPSRSQMLALHANASALALRLAAAFSAALGLATRSARCARAATSSR